MAKNMNWSNGNSEIFDFCEPGYAHESSNAAHGIFEGWEPTMGYPIENVWWFRLATNHVVG